MKIAAIDTFAVSPRWLFVRVRTDEGAEGWGEASLEGHAEAVQGAFEALKDRFLGADPFRIEDIWQIGYRGGFYRGGPVQMSAISGLDQALWDLKGKALGVPVWQLIGGKVRDRVEVYGWIGGDRPHEAAAGAKDRQSQGFRKVKITPPRTSAGSTAPRRWTRPWSAWPPCARPAWTWAWTSTDGCAGPWPSNWRGRWSR